MPDATRTNRKQPNISIELPYEWKARLKKLVKDTSAITRTDAVRRGLAIYSALIEQQQGGWTIVLRKGDEEKPLQLN